VQNRHGEIEQLGGQVLAVSFTPPDKAAAYLARHPLPFPAVVDPERKAYQTFELGRTTWGRLMTPRVLAGYLKLMLRGWWPAKPVEGEEVLQLGGDFVLDADRRLVFAFRSAEATDRPPAEAIVQAVRTAVGQA
jgi:hypothetical protein